MPISGKTNLIIRKGTIHDTPVVYKLIKELAIFEKEPESVHLSEDTLRNDFDAYRLFVAEVDGNVVGMALYFPYYSTWDGKCLYLEDLIVSESYRRHGIGSQLWRALIREAKDTNAARLMWQVLDWNKDAISFYEKLNSKMDNSWVNCRLTREQLLTFDI